MITSSVKAFARFPEVKQRVELAAKEAVEAAAAEAAVVANEGASIDLEIEIVPAHSDVNGYSAGIKSRRTSSRGRRGGTAEENTTPIAWFFDRGTLGNRKRRLKRPRKETWVGTRGGTTYAAHRRDVAGKGIQPERFFGKARTAGRRKLLERIERL